MRCCRPVLLPSYRGASKSTQRGACAASPQPPSAPRRARRRGCSSARRTGRMPAVECGGAGGCRVRMVLGWKPAAAFAGMRAAQDLPQIVPAAAMHAPPPLPPAPLAHLRWRRRDAVLRRRRRVLDGVQAVLAAQSRAADCHARAVGVLQLASNVVSLRSSVQCACMSPPLESIPRSVQGGWQACRTCTGLAGSTRCSPILSCTAAPAPPAGTRRPPRPCPDAGAPAAGAAACRRGPL